MDIQYIYLNETERQNIGTTGSGLSAGYLSRNRVGVKAYRRIALQEQGCS
jgi:hypothetical protein